jgi:hypothetical protein
LAPNDKELPGVEDPDVAEDDERVRKAVLLQQEKIKAFLDELAQLSKRYGVHIEGHGQDTFIIDNFTGVYEIMYDRAAHRLPLEICWCPEDTEGLVDIHDVGT